MARTKFPTLAVIILVLALVWLLSELEYLKIDMPWIPVILGIIAIGMIINRYNK